MKSFRQKMMSIIVVFALLLSVTSIDINANAAGKSFKSIINAQVVVPGTTGNAVLDATCNSILALITTPEMTNYQKIKACYDYLVAYGKYDSMGNWNYPGGLGDCTEEQFTAYGMLTTMKGDCYCFSDAFVALTRVLGFNTYAVRGVTSKSGGGFTNHGWTAMLYNNTEYVFDPQIEMNIYKKNKVNNYYRFAKTYDQVRNNYKQYDTASMNALFGPESYHSWISYIVLQATPCDRSWDNRKVISF